MVLHTYLEFFHYHKPVQNLPTNHTFLNPYHKLDESCRRSVEFENEYISESSFRMPYREYSKMNKEEFKQLEQTIIQEMRLRKELDGGIERGEDI